MGQRLCIEAGCLQPTFATRCSEHQRALDRERNQDPRRHGHPAYRSKPLPPGSACWCCGSQADLTRHHIAPLALPDGPGMDGLVVAMCRPCNSSIGASVMVGDRCPMHGGLRA